MNGVAIMIIGVVIIAIWIVIELKRMRHKVFAIFLIVLIIFSYLSITNVLKGQDIDLKTTSGLIQGTKIYFAWLGSAFGNLKTITSNAIKMDWTSKNQSSEKK